MKKAIILARVSTKEQEEQGLSIEEIQLPKMREYAKNNGFVVVKEFVFQETAAHKLRKNFLEVIEFIKTKEDVKAIIGFRVDRVTRNYRDAVIMDDLRIDYDKELHFTSDRLILHKKSKGNAIQEWDVKVFLAKQHINNCTDHANDTLESRLNSGHSYGHAPYGYINQTDKKLPPIERVILDPYTSGIVKKIFDMYTTGAYSYEKIAQIISNEHKIKMHRRKVEHIISNPYYYGERKINGEMHPHIFERIITKEVYDIAKEIREGRTKTTKKGNMLGKTGLFRGLITCYECGCSYSPSTNRHKRLNRKVQSESYYYCTNSKRKHKVKPKGTNDNELLQKFSALYESINIPEKELDWLIKSLNESHEGKKRFTEAEKNNCYAMIDKYEKMIENAYADKCAGSITQDEFDNFRISWRQKQDEYKSRLNTVLNADEDYYVTASQLLQLASRSKELFLGSESEQKREIITLTLQNLRIKDGKLCYEWQKPFDVIFKHKDGNTWGDWWGSNPRHAAPQAAALPAELQSP